MTAIFLDTSFLIAAVRRGDQDHGNAVEWRRTLQGPFVTTEYVIIEFLDSSALPAYRKRGARAVRVLQADEEVEIVPASAPLMQNGIQLFEKHVDKGWGLTDCLSFVVMRERGIQAALTSDRHFQQAGFRALLKEKPQ